MMLIYCPKMTGKISQYLFYIYHIQYKRSFIILKVIHFYVIFRNLYICPPDSEMSVKHLSVAINKWKYRLQYKNYFGGVSAISKIHFKRVCISILEYLNVNIDSTEYSVIG